MIVIRSKRILNGNNLLYNLICSFYIYDKRQLFLYILFYIRIYIFLSSPINPLNLISTFAFTVSLSANELTHK